MLTMPTGEHVVCVDLTEEMHAEFAEFVEALGVSVPAAIRMLIAAELKAFRRDRKEGLA